MISAFRLYEMYNAMSLHFREGSSYDYFKYDGKTKVTENSFQRAKGKYFYEKTARKLHSEDAAIAFLSSNFTEGCKWVGDLKQEPYDKFLSYRDALYYRFEQDLLKYMETSPFQEGIAGSTDSWNYLILLNEASNGLIFKEYEKKYGDDILWEDFHNKLLTYSPFLIYCYNINQEVKKNLRAIVKKVRSESA